LVDLAVWCCVVVIMLQELPGRRGCRCGLLNGPLTAVRGGRDANPGQSSSKSDTLALEKGGSRAGRRWGTHVPPRTRRLVWLCRGRAGVFFNCAWRGSRADRRESSIWSKDSWSVIKSREQPVSIRDNPHAAAPAGLRTNHMAYGLRVTRQTSDAYIIYDDGCINRVTELRGSY
jgi:hypothetical protein